MFQFYDMMHRIYGVYFDSHICPTPVPRIYKINLHTSGTPLFVNIEPQTDFYSVKLSWNKSWHTNIHKPISLLQRSIFVVAHCHKRIGGHVFHWAPAWCWWNLRLAILPGGAGPHCRRSRVVLDAGCRIRTMSDAQGRLFRHLIALLCTPKHVSNLQCWFLNQEKRVFKITVTVMMR